jgi:hypothetical protein
VSSVPARAPPRPTAPVHAPPPPAPAVMAQPQQPGLMAQMAATAGGVAIGSAVGHVVGAAITGGMGGGHQDQAPAQQAPQPAYQPPQPVYQPAYQQQGGAGPEGGPCALQLRQFLDCAQTQHDVTLCQGFNEALRECKTSYGLSA